MEARIARGLIAVPLLAGVLAADDPNPLVGPLPVRQGPSLDSVHARMNELADGIGERLRAIDQLLWDAPDAPNLGAALEDATRRSRQTLDDIDELLRLADHPHPPSKGGGG